MAFKNGSATLAPSPRSTVRRGNDFAVRKAMSVVSSNQFDAAPIKNGGLFTIPTISDDQR